MRYGHGDCHVWSIPLAQAAFNDGTVEINMYDLDDLFYLVSPDEDEIAEAHDNIEFWYKKTEAYLKQ